MVFLLVGRLATTLPAMQSFYGYLQIQLAQEKTIFVAAAIYLEKLDYRYYEK